MKKQLFLTALALLSMLSIPLHISAYDDVYIGDLCYNLDELMLTAEVTSPEDGCNCLFYHRPKSVTIPSTITYNGETYSVTGIGNYAFNNCDYLISITIPNSITSIGREAFYGCWELASITIPNSVTDIGDYAFYNSSLTSITFPNYLTYLGNNVFDKTPWYNNQPDGIIYISNILYKYKGTMPQGTSIVIKMGTTEINHDAFQGCSGLTSITIPDGVTDIEYNAFEGCTGLTSITIPESVTSIGRDVFSGCTRLTSVVWNAESYSVLCNVGCTISVLPFYFCRENITSFTFGDKVESIPSGLCSGMSKLTSITIPNSVTSIGEVSFSGCTGLTSITISNSLTSIGRRAFSDCTGLTSITIPNSVKSIGDGAFEDCTGLKYIFIPNTVTTTDPYILENCTALDTIILPAGFCDISQWVEGWGTINAWEYAPQALVYAELNGGTITDNATGLLKCSSKTLLTLDLRQTDNMTLPDEAFRGCYKLQTLLLPNNLTSIPYKAAAECASLQSITIPAGVQEIGDRAFAECCKMQSITSYAVTPPTIQAKTFSEVDRSIPVYVPAQSLNDYKTAEYWEEFFNIQAAQSAVEDIYSTDTETPRKVLIDGQVYILRNGKTYTITGNEVK